MLNRNCKKNKSLLGRASCKIPLYLSVLVFVMCLIAKLYSSNSIAVKNDELKELYSKKTELEKEVTRLEYESSLLTAITAVEEKAHNLGFVPMEEPLVSLDINVPYQVASLNQ